MYMNMRIMKINLSVIAAALATVAFLQSSAVATNYTIHWAVPSSDNTYSDWAAGKSFVVGDILVFNFTANKHTVTEVNKSGYDSCNGSNHISQQTSTPASVNLTTRGEHFYICTSSNHCQRGQKLAVNVTGAPTTPSSAPAPPPQGNGAATFGVAGMSATFLCTLALALAFMLI